MSAGNILERDADKRIAELKAQLAESSKWQPIETAPREGFILVSRKHCPFPLIVKFQPEYGQFECLHTGDLVYSLTHWMCIPEMPDQALAVGGE
jgi:hypothetical protein